MSASVVNCLLAILYAASRPRSISLRKPDTVIPPAGKPYLIASSSLRGVSAVMMLTIPFDEMVGMLVIVPRWRWSAFMPPRPSKIPNNSNFRRIFREQFLL